VDEELFDDEELEDDDVEDELVAGSLAGVFAPSELFSFAPLPFLAAASEPFGSDDEPLSDGALRLSVR
jgi:hypothetical protein